MAAALSISVGAQIPGQRLQPHQPTQGGVCLGWGRPPPGQDCLRHQKYGGDTKKDSRPEHQPQHHGPEHHHQNQEFKCDIDAKDADGTTTTSLTTRGGDTKITTNKKVREETCVEHCHCFLQDGKPIRMHTEDIADAANGYTREEIYCRVYCRGSSGLSY